MFWWSLIRPAEDTVPIANGKRKQEIMGPRQLIRLSSCTRQNSQIVTDAQMNIAVNARRTFSSSLQLIERKGKEAVLCRKRCRKIFEMTMGLLIWRGKRGDTTQAPLHLVSRNMRLKLHPELQPCSLRLVHLHSFKSLSRTCTYPQEHGASDPIPQESTA